MNKKLTPEDVSASFLAKAREALYDEGSTALEFLRKHPRLSKVALAQQLNRGCNAIGLVMAIYEDAIAQGVVREIAYEMLLRLILNTFPDGWLPKSDVPPLVELGSWRYELGNYANVKYRERASQLLKELSLHSPPPLGWKPDYPKDQRLDELFDRFWPVAK